LVNGRFVTGRFVTGRYVTGRFVGVPLRVISSTIFRKNTQNKAAAEFVFLTFFHD
jgi:hypothetical protein